MSGNAPARIVTFAEACAIVQRQAEIAAASALGKKESKPLLQSLGMVLAESMAADRDQPPFPRSTRDGFACRAADLTAGRELRVLGQIRAGETWPPQSWPAASTGTSVSLAPGEALEIMTGAAAPPGADCVVMLEHVERQGNLIHLLPGHTISRGANIVPSGAEARAGAVILPAGMRMHAAQIGLAASLGAADVTVFARPRVAILPTGDELVETDEIPLPFQIRNSNSYSLAAQAVAAGAEPVRLPIARDTAAGLSASIAEGLRADLLLLSGGVSMGKYDLVEEVLLEMGAEFFFTGAAIQPGKPIVFGKVQGRVENKAAGEARYFFGLPGNPVSTMVTFSLFVEPFLRALGGEPSAAPRFAQAKLGTGYRGKPGLTRFLPARLNLAAAAPASAFDPVVEPIPWQGSGDMAATSRSNCFLVIPPESTAIAAGDSVTVLLPSG